MTRHGIAVYAWHINEKRHEEESDIKKDRGSGEVNKRR